MINTEEADTAFDFPLEYVALPVDTGPDAAGTSEGCMEAAATDRVMRTECVGCVSTGTIFMMGS